MQVHQQTPCLFFFNRDQSPQSPSDWKQVPLDHSLLERIGYWRPHSLHSGVPLLITSSTVQPFLPASIFSLLHFLGSEQLHFRHHFSDTAALHQTFKSLKDNYYSLYLKGLSTLSDLLVEPSSLKDS